MHHVYIFDIIHTCVLWYLHQRFKLEPKVTFGNTRSEYICSLSFLMTVHLLSSGRLQRTFWWTGTQMHTQTHTRGLAIVQSSSSSEPSYILRIHVIWNMFILVQFYYSWLVYYTSHWCKFHNSVEEGRFSRPTSFISLLLAPTPDVMSPRNIVMPRNINIRERKVYYKATTSRRTL